MIDTSTYYMNLKLKNPFVVGSSNMVDSTDKLLELQNAGASAIVFKSLFEEQVQLETMQLETEIELYNERNAESITLFPGLEHAGPSEHLLKLKQAKALLNVPLIGSLNCVFHETWVEWAKLMEKTGIDGLELNFFSVPRDFDTSADSIENEQVEIVRRVCASVTVPVSVKLSPYYTNVLHVVERMQEAGAKGFILFNRLFEPDISTNSLKHISPFNLSEHGDYRLALRYIGSLYENVKASFIGSTGIHSGLDAVKLILSGADAVQVVSAIYLEKPTVLHFMNADLVKFMETQGFKSLDDFRGLLSKAKTKDPFVYRRAQYIDLLMHSEKIFGRNSPV
jgi:dihydroorotate dehydrogenase (fumarate)